jgi:Ca2+-transporting ATPase
MRVAPEAPPRGLTSSDALRRLRETGPNELVPARKSNSLLAWILRLIADPMAILLLIAGGTYFALGDRFDGIVVLVALAPIFLVGAILEYRSDRALERLSDIAPPRATVVRDGKEQALPAAAIVPEDLLLLREGDVVAADAQVAEATRLLVDEAPLTGESLPVEKTAGERVLAGTVVRSGRGSAYVSETGARTEYGRIGKTLARMQVRVTPIERSIRRLVVQVGIGVLFICAIVIGIQRFHGDPWAVAAIAGVSLAMAAIPEELPMVYTLYLALGAWRLAKDNALVRRLSSVETLGSTTVICVDKTGTLTYGRLAVESVFAVPGKTRDDVLAAAAWASAPASNDPLDAAILQVAGAVRERGELLLEIPFDPKHAYAAAIVRNGVAPHVYVKGAYEALAARGADNNASDAAAFLHQAAGRGARIIAVAEGTAQSADREGEAAAQLELAGLIALADPVREIARDTVLRCRAAGIRFVMITGDHPATARAIAGAAGLDTHEIVTGAELLQWDERELNARIARVDVFARVRPEEKYRIVNALHANGDVVAMTGDGTNDALALREADIGVAMGRTGTEVARAAADLVLLDDNVETIVRAVADGRRIFHNLRHAFSYLNAFHAPLLLSALVLPILGAPILLMPIHLIWLEIVVHPTSALVFENDPPEKGLMSEPPRPPREGLMRRNDWRRALLLGITLAAVVIALYLLLMQQGYAQDAARSAGLVALLCGQTLLVFVERAGSRPLWSVSLHGNAAALPITLLTIATLALAIGYAPLAHVLHLAPIPLATAGIAVGAGCLAVLWTQPYYALRRLKA